MSNTITGLARRLNISVNEVYKILLERDVQLQDGFISDSAIEEITRRFSSSPQTITEPITKNDITDTDNNPQIPKPKREYSFPSEKPSRKHSPSAIHDFVNGEQLDAFIELMEENGEEIQNIPRGYVFGGLVSIISSGLLNRHFKGDSLESVVGDFYPLKTDKGHNIPDNIWLVKGAEMYLGWDDSTRDRISRIITPSSDYLDIAYELKNFDGDLAISAALFFMDIEASRNLRYRPQNLETFKALANGLLIYKNSDASIRESIAKAYEQSHERTIGFANWLFKNGIFSKLAVQDKSITDDNSYLSAIMFMLKDVYGDQISVDISLQQSLDRAYGAFRKMQGFKDRGKPFFASMKKIRKDIDSSLRRTRIDEDEFMANTLKNGTYSHFYNNYSGRGIQYSTFITYAAAAFFMLSENPSQSHEYYANILSRMAKERLPEKIDRLRGQNGRTVIVDICLNNPDDVKAAYLELKDNWGKYKKNLESQGCWKKQSKKECFSFSEFRRMYNFVTRFPEIFST